MERCKILPLTIWGWIDSINMNVLPRISLFMAAIPLPLDDKFFSEKLKFFSEILPGISKPLRSVLKTCACVCCSTNNISDTSVLIPPCSFLQSYKCHWMAPRKPSSPRQRLRPSQPVQHVRNDALFHHMRAEFGQSVMYTGDCTALLYILHSCEWLLTIIYIKVSSWLIIHQCSVNGSPAGSGADDDSHLEVYRL